MGIFLLQGEGEGGLWSPKPSHLEIAKLGVPALFGAGRIQTERADYLCQQTKAKQLHSNAPNDEAQGEGMGSDLRVGGVRQVVPMPLKIFLGSFIMSVHMAYMI